MLKLKRFTKGSWFSFPPAEGVSFLIRPLQLSEGLGIRSRIRKSVVVDVVDPKTKKPFSALMEDVDSGSFTWEVFDYMLVDFKGPIAIEGDDGIEVSIKENMSAEEKESVRLSIKKALFDDEDVRNFVAEKSELLREHGVNKLEEELGN